MSVNTVVGEIVARHVNRVYPPSGTRGPGVAPGSDQPLTVLDDFDLSIRPGEFIALLGPSGCGKSTFLNILAGLDNPTSGEILVEGRPLAGVHDSIGVVFQGYALFPWRTVLGNVEAGLEIRHVPRQQRRAIASEYLEQVGLRDFLHHYPHQISGGMRQRVAIARSLAYSPDILVMDEPFAALDAQTREQLQAQLLDVWSLQEPHKTIVFVTHSLDEAVFLADRVAVMTKCPGRIKEIVDVPLSRPRTDDDRNSPAFTETRRILWEVLKDEVQDV